MPYPPNVTRRAAAATPAAPDGPAVVTVSPAPVPVFDAQGVPMGVILPPRPPDALGGFVRFLGYLFLTCIGLLGLMFLGVILLAIF